MTDRRRFGVIEVSRINSDTYHLTIGGTLWSEVEWSATRQRWCIQDAGGECLAHEEHIVGMDRDPQAAIRRAKRMIISREMPAPEVALAQLEEKLRREELGEPLPWRPLDTEAELIAVEGRRRRDPKGAWREDECQNENRLKPTKRRSIASGGLRRIKRMMLAMNIHRSRRGARSTGATPIGPL
jgi:hypothetical protein